MYEQRTHLYPESTKLITDIETARVQLKQETYIECFKAFDSGYVFLCQYCGEPP